MPVIKTPFCTAIGIANRALDEVRREIGDAQDEAACLAARQAVMVAVGAIERELMSRSSELPETAYFSRAADERLILGKGQCALDQRLEILRRTALERFGEVRALELAAAKYRADRRRQLDRREAAAADDRAAISFLFGGRGG